MKKLQFKFYILLVVGLFILTACNQNKQQHSITKTATLGQPHPMDYIASATTTANWLQPTFKYWGIKQVDQLLDVNTIANGQTFHPLEESPMSLF